MSLKNFLLSWKYRKRFKKISRRNLGISPQEIIIGIARLLLLCLFMLGFVYGIKTSNGLFSAIICISGILSVIIELH